MKKILYLTFLMGMHMSMAQVEINPNSPGVGLEILSQSKGLLLPRINTPSDVNTPKEGLLIYNKDSKTPAFHDGSSWRMVSSSATLNVNNRDSLTYTIINSFGHITTGTNNLESIDVSGIWDNLASGIMFNISKSRDAKTVEFLKFFHDDRAQNSNTLVMEVKAFKKGTTTPYFSYKFKNVKFVAYAMGNSRSENTTIEHFTITSKVYGWWDHMADYGAAYNLSTGIPVSINYNTGF